MINTIGVMHFTIPVSDMERSKKFYTEILGLETVLETPDGEMLFLKSGEDHVILGLSQTLINPNEDDFTIVHHAFMVEPEDYDKSLDFLERNGVKILRSELRDKGVFTGRQCYFHDPDRNVLELIDFKGTHLG